MWKKKFYLYPPLPPLSLISLSPRSPLSQPPLMRKQYNFNIEHGRQLGGKVFPRSFTEKERSELGGKKQFFQQKKRSEPAPSTSSSTFTSSSSSSSAISSHIAVLQFKRLKKGRVSITVSHPTKDHATQFLPCPPLAHCAGMFSTVDQSQASQPSAARP